LDGFEISKATALSGPMANLGAYNVLLAPFAGGFDHWQEVAANVYERIFDPGRDLAKQPATNDAVRLQFSELIGQHPLCAAG